MAPPYTHAALGLGTDKQQETTYVLESYEGKGLFFFFFFLGRSGAFFELVVGEATDSRQGQRKGDARDSQSLERWRPGRKTA